jgi:hypothetical protein
MNCESKVPLPTAERGVQCPQPWSMTAAATHEAAPVWGETLER